MLKLFAEKKVRLSKLQSYRAEHFPYSGPYPWLDQPNASEQVDARLAAGILSPEQAQACQHWVDSGYLIIPGLIAPAILDRAWLQYEDAIAAGKVKLELASAGNDDPYPDRYLNPHKKVGAFCRILNHPELRGWLHLLTGREPKALQSISSHKGTQQAIHSDSIHMTTYPLGYLTAAWIAFEDIDPASGPLEYYPGSHQLPYVFSHEVGITEDEFRTTGYQSYQQKYEPFIQSSIKAIGLQPEYFHARKGDVLIWHANLLHGGAKRENLQLSRKALVCHYHAKGAFVYHDLAASRSKQQYMSTCLLQDNIDRLKFLQGK